MSKHLDLMQSLSSLNPSSIKKFSAAIGVLLETKLWAKILAGMFFGLILGMLVSPTGVFSNYTANYTSEIESLMNWLALPAKFFLKLIQMVIVPLIIASIIRGLASSSNVSQMKSLGIKFAIFVLFSSLFAASLGVALSFLLSPGVGLNMSGALPTGNKGSEGTLNGISPDLLVNILPANPLASIVEGQMLEVVILALIMGIALISIEAKQAKSILDLLETVQSICMTIISWAMKLAPFAVFGMIAQVSSSTGLRALEKMGWYVLTAFLGFFLMIFAYTLIVFFIKRLSPVIFIKKISSAMLLAFSTSSSAATMPLTMKVAEENLNINAPVARFLIPLATTVNMAGSAIWHTTAVIFVSQAYGFNLSLAQIAFVVATSIGSAIGSPGVPGVGVGVLSAVLMKIGVPLEGVSLILGVDRLVDMGCTVVNVTGDLTASFLFGTNNLKSS